MKQKNPSICGFSLVEVCIALGVVVFCLVTILGLLAVGANSTHGSVIQTSATNILTEVTSDVEATPNITPNYSQTPVQTAKGGVNENSPIFAITLPATVSTSTATTAANPTVIYIGEDGQKVTTVSTALYRLNVWTTAASTTHAETFVRLLISWPASVVYTSAQGYVENVIAINRT